MSSWQLLKLQVVPFLHLLLIPLSLYLHVILQLLIVVSNNDSSVEIISNEAYFFTDHLILVVNHAVYNMDVSYV